MKTSYRVISSTFTTEASERMRNIFYKNPNIQSSHLLFSVYKYGFISKFGQILFEKLLFVSSPISRIECMGKWKIEVV